MTIHTPNVTPHPRTREFAYRTGRGAGVAGVVSHSNLRGTLRSRESAEDVDDNLRRGAGAAAERGSRERGPNATWCR